MTWSFRPANAVFAWLVAIAAGLPLLLIGVLVATGDQRAPSSAVALAVLVPLAFAAPIAWAIRRNEIRLAADRISIRSSFYRFSVPLSSIVPGSIRRVDLRVDREWRPRFRTNGVALPGYRSGWFRLVDRRRAFLALAQGDALGFATHDGVAVLVSPVEVDAFEARLRERIGSP